MLLLSCFETTWAVLFVALISTCFVSSFSLSVFPSSFVFRLSVFPFCLISVFVGEGVITGVISFEVIRFKSKGRN